MKWRIEMTLEKATLPVPQFDQIQLADLKQQIEQAIQRVNSMNSTIAEEWKGQAFQAYLEQYNELYQNVKKFEDLLESINQQLNKYADTVAERDAQDAQSFGF